MRRVVLLLFAALILAPAGEAQGQVISIDPQAFLATTRVDTAADLPPCDIVREDWIYGIRDTATEVRCTGGLWLPWGGAGDTGPETDPIFGASPAALIVDAGSRTIISASERLKLSGVEPSAAADQVAAEVPVAPAVFGATDVQAALEALAGSTAETDPVYRLSSAAVVIAPDRSVTTPVVVTPLVVLDEDDAEAETWIEGGEGHINFVVDGEEMISVNGPDLEILFEGALILAHGAPSSSSEPCTSGALAWDDDYLYLCTIDSGWGRTALTTGW
ncbi:MAG: hypothetical protein AAGN46_08210 [Acidobacteriota bacterium]